MARLSGWWDTLTWTCHVCRRTRPDEKIGVHKRPVTGHESMFPRILVNVRYCRDDPDCVTAETADGPWTPGATQP